MPGDLHAWYIGCRSRGTQRDPASTHPWAGQGRRVRPRRDKARRTQSVTDHQARAGDSCVSGRERILMSAKLLRVLTILSMLALGGILGQGGLAAPTRMVA